MAHALLKDASVWANVVKGGVIKDVKRAKEMAGVLRTEYKPGAGEASKLLSKAGCDVNDVAGDLKGV